MEVLRISHAQSHAATNLHARFAVLLPQYASDPHDSEQRAHVAAKPDCQNFVCDHFIRLHDPTSCDVLLHQTMRYFEHTWHTHHSIDLQGLFCWLCCVLGLFVLNLVPTMREYN